MPIFALKKTAPTLSTGVQARTRYYPQLDGLRAIAVLMVLLCHWVDLNVSRVAVHLLSIGWIGVDVFFVLSGFLITKILLNCRPSLRGFGLFVFRRILRTWPLYFALLIVASLILPRLPSGAYIPWGRYLVFTQNYVQGGPTRTLGPTWSLCVEEHFYFIWPLLVFLLPRRALLPILAAIFTGLPLLRFWGWHHGLTWQLYIETQFHLDGLVAGSCVALLLPWHSFRPRVSKWVAILLFVLGAIAAIAGFRQDGTVDGMVHYGHNIVFGFTSLAVTFASLLWLLLHEESSRLVKVFSLRPLRYIGRISYGIYLLHDGLTAALDRLPLHRVLGALADSWMLLIPLRMGVVIGVAAISYRFFESPILRWKERFK